MVIIFTNYEFKSLYPYLSDDRWEPFIIDSTTKELAKLEHFKGQYSTATPFKYLKEQTLELYDLQETETKKLSRPTESKDDLQETKTKKLSRPAEGKDEIKDTQTRTHK
jgi:hypothetical protein